MTHRYGGNGVIFAVKDVEIGAADPSSEYLHHHLPCPNDRLGPLGEGDVPRARSELGEADHAAPETRA